MVQSLQNICAAQKKGQTRTKLETIEHKLNKVSVLK